MVESIGQFGPGLKPPIFHELRLPLLEKAKKETHKLREKHEKAWKQYGSTLMSDGWTDKRGRHLINFLVNSPEGTFFLKSVDVSSKVQDARMLTDLFEEQIDLIGRDIVVQVVTDNGANFKAAGGLLCQRICSLYWTPCAAHCLDLMLEDITKLKEFDATITHGRGITTFIYRHGRLLYAMREKTMGRDIVKMGATRFATAFLTLQSLYKNKDALRKMVLDTSVVEKISDQADQYENLRNSFGKQLSIRQRKTKNPLDWWGAFGGNTIELAMFAKRVVGLCCSSAGCERNWSTFEFIHTKKRNRLEHQRLNDLVYVQYNRKLATRFQKRREGGKNFDPLLLDDFQWDNE
ncbi:hypothetical protein OROHE_002576 [Orobanche hederae]